MVSGCFHFYTKSSAEVPEDYDDISRMEFFGFSADGQELIFSESVYDMENGIFLQNEDLDEFGGRHMCTAPGSPVISADIDLNSENYDYVLSWWVDGKEKKSTVLPYEGSIYGSDLDDPKNVCLHIGGNGCAVVTLYENIGAMIFPVLCDLFFGERKSGILLQAFAGGRKSCCMRWWSQTMVRFCGS